MATKKKGQLVRTSRIFQWIQDQDERLAGAIRDLCMEGALEPGQGAGVTFLYPKDKAYRDEIVDMAYSDSADGAVKMVNALIIPDALHNASDFQRRPIGSISGVLYEVEDAAGDTVKLKGGVALKRADNSKQEKKDLAIWIITAGRAPLSGGEYKRPRRAGPGSAAADSARARGGGAPLPGRTNMAAQTEKEFDDCMRKDGCIARDPYLAKVVSLLDFLEAQHPDILRAVLPLIDYNPIVTFYLLLEPYKTSGEPIISDATLFGPSGWNGAETFTDAVAEYRRFFGMIGADGESSAHVFKDHAAVVQAVDRIRQQISQVTDKMSLPRQVRAAYDQLVTSNAIGGLAPIYSDATLALLRPRKLWQDEFRFIVHAATQQLYDSARSPSGSMYRTDDFGAVARMVRFDRPGNDYAKEAGMIDMVAMKGNVAPTADFYMLKKFANSTDFLYTPAPGEMVGGYMGSADDPTDPEIYNRNYEAMRSVGRSRTRRAVGISPQALTELRMYSLRHGGDLTGLGLGK